GADRLLQLRDPVDVGVLGLAVADRLDGRFLDVLRRVEVGLARGEADDVAALRLQLARLLVGRQRGGGRHARAAGGLQRHGGRLPAWTLCTRERLCRIVSGGNADTRAGLGVDG